MAEDLVDGVDQVSCDGIRLENHVLGVAAFNEHRPTPGILSGADIAPTVSNHHACREVDIPVSGRFREHARIWLVAGTLIYASANPDIVDRHGFRESGVHLVQHLWQKEAGTHVLLVGHHDNQVACRLQPPYRTGGVSQDDKVFQGPRRIGPAAAEYGSVQDTVAIEESGSGLLVSSVPGCHVKTLRRV